MAGLVLIALIVMAIVFIAVSKNRKRAMLISVGIIGVYPLYVSHICGSNNADVKVMKPMAEKISEYIVKNGIPKSLKDIPDLPYGLEGCEYITKNVEQCFFNKNKKYKTEIYILGSIDISIYSKNTETGLRTSLKENKSKHWYISEKNITYSGKSSGICNSMKQ